MNKPIKTTVGEELDRMDADKASLSIALVKALAEIEGVTKDKVNPHFKSKYADLSSVLETVRPVFARYDMAVTQETAPSEDGVIVETVVLHTSGAERRFGQLYVPANKRDAQGAGSALTYARRYSLMTALGIPAEDDDGNAAVKATSETRATANMADWAADRINEKPARTAVKLDGPYTSPTALKTAAREFVRTLEGLGDIDEFIAWSETKDYREFCAQLQKDMPDWWHGGPSVPAEFVPLEIRIAQRRSDLEKLEGVR